MHVSRTCALAVVAGSYNLLNFNSSAHFVLPSYHAQTLLSRSLGTHTLPTTLTPPYAPTQLVMEDEVEVEVVQVEGGAAAPPPPPPERWLATASITPAAANGQPSTLAIKLVNYGGSERLVDIEWTGAAPLVAASAHVLTADDADAQNTLDEPDTVVPSTLTPPPQIAPSGKGMHLVLPPWSLVVVNAMLRG
jgi:alpha-L-arabinofuranosidase